MSRSSWLIVLAMVVVSPTMVRAAAQSIARGEPVSVGPKGGTIVSANGRAELTIRPGSIRSATTVQLRPAVKLPVDGAYVDSSAYELVVGGRSSFAGTLVISYEPRLRPAGTDERALAGVVMDSAKWIPYKSQVDAGAHRLSIAVGGAGTYGVRWSPPRERCTAPQHRQFDFWLGEWGYSMTDALPGRNIITADSSGCAIYENFTQPGYRGNSISLYNAADGHWYQTYRDSDGSTTRFTGEFTNGRMLLHHEGAPLRTGWMRLDDHRVRFWVEETKDNGATWKVVRDGSYTKP